MSLLFVAFCGCASVPEGYDADLTPGDGSAYIGERGEADQSLTQRRQDAKVRAAMKAHLAKEHWCAWCETTKTLEVHHIWPISSRPDLAAADSNLITLCHDCHRFVAHPGGDSKKWVSNIRELCLKRLLCGPGTDAP